MFINDIRQQIDRAVQQPGATDTLHRHLAATLRGEPGALDDERIDQAVSLVKQYILQVPVLLEQTVRVAEESGESGNIGPLLEAASIYFTEPLDYIPDHIGLYGLLDDAYLTCRLLDSLYRHYERETGLPLMPANLTRANRLARVFLGREMTDRLDAIVSQAVQQRIYEVSLMELSSHSYNGGNRGRRWGNAFEDRTARFFAENGVSMNLNTSYVDQDGVAVY